MKPLIAGKKVSVIGACGRIGLPLTYIIAQAGFEVVAIDLNEEIPKQILDEKSDFPYIEAGLKNWMDYDDLGWKKVYRDRVVFTSNYSSLSNSDYVVVIVGTPVDGENNPRVENIIKLFDEHIIPSIKPGQTIILRSTVFPGMTDLLMERISSARQDLTSGVNFHLVFAPERVSQGKSLKETVILPQLVGGYNSFSLDEAKWFFNKLGVQKIKTMLPLEAEYGKLITNMYRYINFAFANEVYMMTADKNVNIHKVIESVNEDYPRMNMPLPGPNSAGPCLFKDGKLLVDDTPYGDLVNVAFHINEGMPKFIFNLAQKYAFTHNLPFKKAAIVGMTFKANIDDTRFSASYKLKKILIRNGIEVVECDPYLNKTDIESVDVVFLMTPHTGSQELIDKFIKESNTDTIIADAWGYTNIFGNGGTMNGVYKMRKEWL